MSAQARLFPFRFCNRLFGPLDREAVDHIRDTL